MSLKTPRSWQSHNIKSLPRAPQKFQPTPTRSWTQKPQTQTLKGKSSNDIGSTTTTKSPK